MPNRKWIFERWTVLVGVALSLGCTPLVLAQNEVGPTPGGDINLRTGREEEAAGTSVHPSPQAGDPVAEGPLTREMLDHSLVLGRRFLLASQLSTGLFRYQINFQSGESLPEQSPVRQAGALWGLALVHQDQPSPESREAVVRGLAFFAQHSQLTTDGKRFTRFPGAGSGESGAVALVVLALVDFLSAEPTTVDPTLSQHLEEYLRFLLSLERRDHCFYPQYLLSSGEGWGQPSPYFDGEIVLALTKTVRHLRRTDLVPLIQRAVDATFATHARQAIVHRRDDPATKGYFQWACLTCSELHDARWPDAERYARHAIDLARWMIEVHRTLDRPFNTAYAQEGILAAYHLAQSVDDAAAQEQFRRAIDVGLAKLSTWQVGSEYASAYLRQHADHDASCTGGILTSSSSPWLRIDTTQHQMHAVILARKYLWPDSAGRPRP